MPPKIKLTKDDIGKAALSVIRARGQGTLNARILASELSSSTQPIFSNYQNMDDVREAVKKLAYEEYLKFAEREIKSERYPAYKASGMAYIRFAKEEPELFKLIFMCERRDGEPEWDSFTDEKVIPEIMKSLALKKERAERLHLEMWALVHGIAVMYASSYLSIEEETVSEMLSDVYRGISIIHKEKNSYENN